MRFESSLTFIFVLFVSFVVALFPLAILHVWVVIAI